MKGIKPILSIFIGLFAGTAMLALAIGWGAAAPNGTFTASTATRTATTSPTLTPQPPPPTIVPTLTPTPALLGRGPLIASLQRQLDFAFGGGGGGVLAVVCQLAMENFASSAPPVFLGERQPSDSRTGTICLSGLEFIDPLKIKITGADGKIIGSAEFKVAQTVEDDAILNQTLPVKIAAAGEMASLTGTAGIIQLNVWLPPDLTNNTWKVEAQSGARRIRGELQPVWPDDTPAIFLKTKKYNPFARPTPIYDGEVGRTELGRLKPGQALTISGIHLPANQSLPLALYQRRTRIAGLSGLAELAATDMVMTNGRGELQHSLSIAPWMPPGLYHLTLVTGTQLGTPYTGPFLGIYADTCPGAPDSDLLKGDTVTLNPLLVTQNNIRSNPGTKAKIVGQLGSNDTAEILDDFRCVEQMVWWKVHTSSGMEGWTAEGQGTQRFLAPAE